MRKRFWGSDTSGGGDTAIAAVVTPRDGTGQELVSKEIRCTSLAELYETCARERVARVRLVGPRGEVRLQFAALIRPGEDAG